MAMRIISYIEKKNNLINKLRQLSNLLLPGRYCLNNSLTFLYHDDKVSFTKAYSQFGKSYYGWFKKIILFFVKLIIFRKGLYLGDNEYAENPYEFYGTVCSLGVDRNNIKIFDFLSNKVLTYYINPNEYAAAMNNYFYFKDFFTIPEILYYDMSKFITIEEFVDSKPAIKWTEDEYAYVLSDAFKNLSKYLSYCRVSNAFYSISLRTFIKYEIKPDRMNRYIISKVNTSLLDQKYPFLKLHGDLWTPNIMLSKENGRVYYIDFEFSEDLIFFYDIYWLIVEQAIMNNNYFYVSNYLSGTYDKCLMAIFEIFDIPFDSCCRVEYINIFFIVYSAKRWNSLKKRKKKQYFHRYKKFAKKVNELNERLSDQ